MIVRIGKYWHGVCRGCGWEGVPVNDRRTAQQEMAGHARKCDR